MIKVIFKIFLVLTIFVSCNNKNETNHIPIVNWENRKAINVDLDSLINGKTYLPVYSHIYHTQEHKTFDLTITVSIRNVSTKDSIFIKKADYYNTRGENIRQYLKNSIFIKPMETVEIVIAEEDKEGGSGANFMFDWAVNDDKNIPLIEAVMISTYGQQGLSFSTRGVQVFDD